MCDYLTRVVATQMKLKNTFALHERVEIPGHIQMYLRRGSSIRFTYRYVVLNGRSWGTDLICDPEQVIVSENVSHRQLPQGRELAAV